MVANLTLKMALRAAEGESHRCGAVGRGFKPALCGSGCVGIAPAPLLQAPALQQCDDSAQCTALEVLGMNWNRNFPVRIAPVNEPAMAAGGARHHEPRALQSADYVSCP
jgi:hypothetical protein